MSNTLNTPVEALEYSFPLRLEQYSLRPDSGGAGQQRGGDGLIRAIRFLTPVTVTVTSERRKRGAYGLQGGQDGRPGRNSLIQGESITELPGKFTRQLDSGDILQIETPGGGGWGQQVAAVSYRAN
jgi:N-methylhydantoinase B